MKKILLGIAAALVLAACSENKQQETTEAVDTASNRPDDEPQEHTGVQRLSHQP